LHIKARRKSHLYSVAFAHTAFSGAVVTHRAVVQPRPQQAKPAHTDFDLCRHTGARSPSLRLKWSPCINTLYYLHYLFWYVSDFYFL